MEKLSFFLCKYRNNECKLCRLESRHTGNNHNHNLSLPIHQACANLMDELVSLWRIACLNPALTSTTTTTTTTSSALTSSDVELERQLNREQLMQWHQSLYERLKRFCNHLVTTANVGSTSAAAASHHHHHRSSPNLIAAAAAAAMGMAGGDGGDRLRRLDPELFSGFLPAIYACDMTWDEFDLDSMSVFKRHCERLINEKRTHTTTQTFYNPHNIL